MLAEALRHVRPAFDTHAEALASGAYRHPPAPMLANAPAPTSPAPTARPAPTSPAPAPPPSPESRPAPASLPRALPAATGPFVIQLAAFRERDSADALVLYLRERFPDWLVVVEESIDVIRVALGEWNSATSAEEFLTTVRSEYPDAWVRTRRLP
jgi:cell division septation protein DedD